MSAAIKSFQIAGAEFLAARNRALLADEPGVGKTAQVVLACHLVNARSVRVVCPAVGVFHWKAEFEKWWPGNALPRLDISSYDRARSEYIDGLLLSRFHDVCVLDESHYAKSISARRSKAVLGPDGIGAHSRRIWCLSGTPAPNNASELYIMLKTFGAVRMDFAQYCDYFREKRWDGKIIGTKRSRIAELRRIMEPFTLRRIKKDVLPELGAIDVQAWNVELSPEWIQTLVMGPNLDGSEAKAQALKQANELEGAIAGMDDAQLAAFLEHSDRFVFATMRRVNAMAKAPAVFEQVRFEIENGLLDKIVIYGYHREPMYVLKHQFNQAGIGAELMYGGTPQYKREKMITRWKRKGGPKVMLASILAAGVVVDFTEAHQGIMLEMDWVPGNNFQAMQRMHRHGQEYPVTVRVAIGSDVDGRIDRALTRKAADMAALFNEEQK